MKQYSLPKNKRIASNRRFKEIILKKQRKSDGLLTVYMTKNDLDYPRLGVSVVRSSLSAVRRNRLKRLIREVFRLSQNEIPPGFDYLVMISPKRLINSSQHDDISNVAEKVSFERIKTSFLNLRTPLTAARTSRLMMTHTLQVLGIGIQIR